MRKLELLAPAKNLEVGIAAIDHGADAVYIGASHHGARAAAGNSLEDIKVLCDYAHQFGVTVHVTVNTIVYEKEVEDTIELIHKLAGIGVDAILIQDMGVLYALKKNAFSSWKNPIELHASTQCDTRTAAKVSWLHSLGFNRVVLARELSVEEIKDIHQANPDVELEVFVHGALCVSYSGVCYASQYCFGRSANRGECAQFCRLGFDLVDDNNRTVEHDRHLLSLKDMCQINNLEALAGAGASAFKIEGRLKDADYVKNVVAAYSEKLNDIISRHPGEYCRASQGRVTYTFTPNLSKTFNRGYTTYFADGRRPDIASFDTPKALGEHVGHVKEMRRDSFNVAGTAAFANGDGLVYFAPSAEGGTELKGFRVNRAVGNRIYPFRMPRDLRPGMLLYRNHDEAFGRILAGNTAERKIPICMTFGMTPDGFKLNIAPEGRQNCEVTVAFSHQKAQKPQHDNIVRQLTKLGNTPYICDKLEISDGADQYFIPSSLLSDLRRSTIEKLQQMSSSHKSVVDDNGHHTPETSDTKYQIADLNAPEYQSHPYLYNIANRYAKEFYEEQGLKNPQSAFELEANSLSDKQNGEALLMQCRHCIRYSLGYCVKRGGRKPTWKEPLRLRLPDGRKFRLEFKCNECQMNIIAE